MDLLKSFNPKTVAVSFFGGSVFATALWIVIYMKMKCEATLIFYLPPLLAILFLVPLLPFSVNLIVEKEESSFGDDEIKFRRNILFLLMALQFVPVLISIALTFAHEESEIGSNTLALQILANVFFLFSSLWLKFGNYSKSESSDSF